MPQPDTGPPEPRPLDDYPTDTCLTEDQVDALMADHGLELTLRFEHGHPGAVGLGPDGEGIVTHDPEPSGFVAELHTPDYLTGPEVSALLVAGRLAEPTGGTLYADGSGSTSAEAMTTLRRIIRSSGDPFATEPPY